MEDHAYLIGIVCRRPDRHFAAIGGNFSDGWNL
jgi:hypothetical protein